ncbi:hypothetical protein DEO72_LG7g1328 [Vigna unguiculata]|uniref:Uncharacterized protein n=1 Tax=Vigna unguiculata TaxID=3917 RepID=A0A4D6MHL7_VIGUN|nr:hypothetical protein DEO72_LG7g1328 [Vigna unguiculata]
MYVAPGDGRGSCQAMAVAPVNFGTLAPSGRGITVRRYLQDSRFLRRLAHGGTCPQPGDLEAASA